MLSIRSEDMLAYYTADQFATGFKKRPAFQLRGITWNSGSSCEGIWITKRQPGSSCPSPDVMAFVGSKDMLCRVAILNIGWEDTLAQFTIEESATGFKKSLAFQPDGIKQSKVPSGEGIWTTNRQPGSSYTSPDVLVLMGSKDTLCKVVMLSIGVEDTLAHITMAAGFKKMLAFQPCGIKPSRGSSGEGIWITTRHRSCAIFDFVVGTGQLFRLLVTSHPCLVSAYYAYRFLLTLNFLGWAGYEIPVIMIGVLQPGWQGL
ncbi:hypothetical protein AK812_SmicGene15181 [Symbiodinium microadriaticum]|uniref:Uncharacterized protein n=1 Tax=Symbiodinium microadriaticum TaxID=2951 RepID=A0A1Q9E3M7_SYMMI|nr:hypothetical protein AK812_SmicGene15181 [Symbiodinium microadriaticum]